MPCFRPECQPLMYVILPYFNFCGFQKRRELFIEFVEHMKDTNGVRVVIAEVDGPANLPRMCVWKHLRIKPASNIWVKECLVNMAVKSLPKNWERMAWIDADIEFLNKDWVHEAILELGSADVIQLFQTAVNLGPNGESIKIDKSFAYMAKDSGTPYVVGDQYGFWHPGYAWACTQRAGGRWAASSTGPSSGRPIATWPTLFTETSSRVALAMSTPITNSFSKNIKRSAGDCAFRTSLEP